MKKNTIKLAGAVLIVIILLGMILFNLRDALGDVWAMEDNLTEQLTKKSELNDYLEFYPAGEDSISADKGTFIIYNKTDQVWLTGVDEDYRLQKKVWGEWCDDSRIIWDIPAGPIDVPPGEYRFTINWGTDYTGHGKLSPGTYRVIKDCFLINKRTRGPSEYLDLTFAYEFKIR